VGRKILAGYQMTILSLRLEHTYSKKCNFYSQKPQTISCEEKPKDTERDLLDIFITSQNDRELHSIEDFFSWAFSGFYLP